MMAIVDKSTWNIKLLHLQYMPSFHSIDAEGSIQAFIGASFTSSCMSTDTG